MPLQTQAVPLTKQPPPGTLPPVDHKATLTQFRAAHGQAIDALASGTDPDVVGSKGVETTSPELLAGIRKLVGASADEGSVAKIRISTDSFEPGAKTVTLMLEDEKGMRHGRCQYDAISGQLHHIIPSAAYRQTNIAETALTPVLEKHHAALSRAKEDPAAAADPEVRAAMDAIRSALGLKNTDEINFAGAAFSFRNLGAADDVKFKLEITRDGEDYLTVGVREPGEGPNVTYLGEHSPANMAVGGDPEPAAGGATYTAQPQSCVQRLHLPCRRGILPRLLHRLRN